MSDARDPESHPNSPYVGLRNFTEDTSEFFSLVTLVRHALLDGMNE